MGSSRSSSYSIPLSELLDAPLLKHSSHEKKELLDVLYRHCSFNNEIDGNTCSCNDDAYRDVIRIKSYVEGEEFLLRRDKGDNETRDDKRPTRKERENLVLIPVLQHSSLGIDMESKGLTQLLTSAKLWSTLTSKCHEILVSTPYPSFLSPLIQAFSEQLNVNNNVKLIVPSPRSHGFGNATGWKSLVPLMHSSVLFQAIEEVNKLTCSSGRWSSSSSSSSSGDDVSDKRKQMEVFLYTQDKWTYHAKGLWIFPVNSNDSSRGDVDSDSNRTTLHQEVCASYIGSSNMGHRSWTRDLELGYILCVNNRTVSTSANVALANSSMVSLRREWSNLNIYSRRLETCNGVNPNIRQHLSHHHHHRHSYDNLRKSHTFNANILNVCWKTQLSRILGRTLHSFL